MNRIFGKKKDLPPPPTLNDATTRIDASVSRLDEKIAKLDGELRRYKEQMKKATGAALNSIKKRAMQTLKQKKMYENQRDQMAAQGFNIDSTKFALDMVQDQQIAVQAMQVAATSLKAEQRKVKLSDVENVYDDMEDLMEEMNEINEDEFFVYLGSSPTVTPATNPSPCRPLIQVMSRSYGLGDDVDESELDAELSMLEDDLEAVGAADGMPDYLPTAPSQAPSALAPLPAAAAEQRPIAAGGFDEFGLPVAP